MFMALLLIGQVFLLRYFASLYDGACMLFISGLMGLSSLCIFIKALRFGAIGFICVKYFRWFLSTTVLHLYLLDLFFK